MARSGSSRPETKAQAEKELAERMIIEAMGNLGLMPFYKDIRRMMLKANKDEWFGRTKKLRVGKDGKARRDTTETKKSTKSTRGGKSKRQ